MPKPEQWTEVRMAVVTYTHSDRVECNCGWSRTHPRSKILENAIDRHFAKRHQGKGIRL
jgi:hypothetical protein